MSPLDPRLAAGLASLDLLLPSFGLRVADALTVPGTPSDSATRFLGAVRLELALDRPGRRRGTRVVTGVRVDVLHDHEDSLRYGALGGALADSRSAVGALAGAAFDLGSGSDAFPAASNDLVRRARVALAAGPYSDLLAPDGYRVLERLRRDLPGPSSVSTVLAATGVFEDHRTVAEDGAAILSSLADGAPLEWVARRFPGLVS